MIAPEFPRPLQTALDDTLGESQRSTKVLVSSIYAHIWCPNVLGFAPIIKVKDMTPVFDAARLGPDIGSLHCAERKF